LFQVNPEVHRIGNASYAEFVRKPTIWRDVAILGSPFLAVTGELDIRPDWPVKQLIESMPNASLVMIPGAPHDLWYTHPVELEHEIVRFVATLPEITLHGEFRSVESQSH
jgi:proline iminopeptidase